MFKTGFYKFTPSKMSDNKSQWVMPEWMTEYEKYIEKLSESSIEDLTNGRASLEAQLISFIVEEYTKGQVRLLKKLHENNHLK